jgi:hypothetical protein
MQSKLEMEKGDIIMADTKKGPDKQDSGNEQKLIGKLNALEESLEAIEQSKKQRNLVSIVGLLLIILAISLFAMNISNFAKEKATDSNFHKELLTKLAEDMKEVSANPNLQAIMNDIKGEILPNLSKEILERFKKDAPKFQEKGEDLAKNIQDYLEKDVKQKLVKSLTKALLDVEGILKEKYPEISSKDLKKILDAAQATFIIEITNVIESKLDSVNLEIGALKQSINKFQECAEYKKLDPQHPDTLKHVKLQMVESMLELVIYQINTQKGESCVADSAGGVK